MGHIDVYSQYFEASTKPVTHQAHSYLKGLFQCVGRKNSGRMQGVVDDTMSYDSRNHFITHVNWNRREVLSAVARNVNGLLGSAESTLLIDESSFEKKGKHTVGVARQYLGCTGKVDNGQVAVFSALCKDDSTALIDAELYLPQEWCDDPERCKTVGIPEEFQTYRSVEQIAVDLVRRAGENEVEFGWVCVDGGYSQGYTFIDAMLTDKKDYVIDIASNRRVYFSEPTYGIPEKKGKSGRTPSKEQYIGESHSVSALADSILEEQWQMVTIRQGTKGSIIYPIFSKEVWFADENTQKTYHQKLLIRKETDGTYKYSISNNLTATITVLAKVQAQRYWIERCFQDAKQHWGLGDSEARKWKAWYGHVAMVLIASHFALTVRQKTEKYEEPLLLSMSELETLFAEFLPRKTRSKEEIIEHITNQATKRYRKKHPIIQDDNLMPE